MSAACHEIKRKGTIGWLDYFTWSFVNKLLLVFKRDSQDPGGKVQNDWPHSTEPED